MKNSESDGGFYIESDEEVGEEKQQQQLLIDFDSDSSEYSADGLPNNKPNSKPKRQAPKLQLRPNFADAWSNLASAYMRKGRLSEAAQCCRQALALNPLRWGTNEKGVIEIMGHRTSPQLRLISNMARLSRRNSLDILRYETPATEAKLAEAEAEILFKSIKDKEYNNDEILRIVATRRKAQLVATFSRYKDVHGDSITKHLHVHHDSEYVVLLETVVECIPAPHEYLESVIRDGLLKRGTDEDSVTRVVVTQEGRDLNEIKDMYYKRNSVTLEHAVDKEIHGDYKQFILLCSELNVIEFRFLYLE